MIGRVVSDKTTKTVTVLVGSRKAHPLYKKTYAWSKKYLVHDEVGAVMGDIVEIKKSRPFSKRKHWMVVKVVGRDIVPMNEEALKEMSQEDIAEVMPSETEEAEVETVEAEVKAEEKTEVKKPANKAKKAKETK
jgi:small subunit ribosomal protein S17